MRNAFNKVANAIKQTTEDIGFGMVLPDTASNKLWETGRLWVSAALVGAAVVENNPYLLSGGLSLLAGAAINYRNDGAVVRRLLDSGIQPI